MIMLYFSGTGNSRYIAELFSKAMDCECHSIEEAADFGSLIAAHDCIAFCYPVYGSRVPRPMQEFVLRQKEHLQGKELIILCTQLIFSGDGARVFTDIFPRNFVDVIYAEHIWMPNNVCNLFILPLAKREGQMARIKKAERDVKRICGELKRGVRRTRGFNPISRALGLIQGVFYPWFVKTGLSRVWIDEDCVKCLLCVSLCPMRNIRNSNGSPHATGNCAFCYRCINACPSKAIAVYLRAKVKKQYQVFF